MVERRSSALLSVPRSEPVGAALEQSEYLVEQPDDVRERAAYVEQVRHGAEQRAEQSAGRGGVDVEHDAVEVDFESEQIEVERAQLKVQDVARRGVDGDGQLDGLERRADDVAVAVLDGAGQRPDGDYLVVDDLELADGEVACELPALAGRPRDGDADAAREGRGGARRLSGEGCMRCDALPASRTRCCRWRRSSSPRRARGGA